MQEEGLPLFITIIISATILGISIIVAAVIATILAGAM
jgi:urea transporter